MNETGIADAPELRVLAVEDPDDEVPPLAAEAADDEPSYEAPPCVADFGFAG